MAALKDTPIPNILVGGGLVFLLLALAGQIAGKIEIPPGRQKWAGIIGVLLLISGVALHLSPRDALPTNAVATTQAPPAPAVSESGAPLTRAPVSSPSAALPTTSRATDCFGQYFAELSADRVKTIEMGVSSFQLIAASAPKDDAIGIMFTELNQVIGGMRFSFISGSEVFKVETVVDARCQAIATTPT